MKILSIIIGILFILIVPIFVPTLFFEFLHFNPHFAVVIYAIICVISTIFIIDGPAKEVWDAALGVGVVALVIGLLSSSAQYETIKCPFDSIELNGHQITFDKSSCPDMIVRDNEVQQVYRVMAGLEKD